KRRAPGRRSRARRPPSRSQGAAPPAGARCRAARRRPPIPIWSPQELVRDRHAGMLGHADGRGLDEAARKTFAATPKITKPMEGGMIFHGAVISYMNMISYP